MSEERTQPPSKRRRQLAREQGQVAHSPELTAAAGWLVALALLGLWGSDLARGLVEITREPLAGTPLLSARPVEVVARVRAHALALALPLAVIVLGFAAGAIATHQLQVRGLWATALIAPDPARLWSFGREGGAAHAFERLAWAVTKAGVLAAVSIWAVRAVWHELERLSAVETSALAGASGAIVFKAAFVVGIVMLALGMVDYGLRYMRFEAMLRTTPQEQREDHRVMEGDLSLRSQRRRLARAWRGDDPELLAGASLVVRGDRGSVRGACGWSTTALCHGAERRSGKEPVAARARDRRGKAAGSRGRRPGPASGSAGCRSHAGIDRADVRLPGRTGRDLAFPVNQSVRALPVLGRTDRRVAAGHGSS